MSTTRLAINVAAALGLLIANAHAGPNWVVKDVAGSDWQWFEEYVYLTANYTVACAEGRQCQVGMGLFAFGEPRGEKIRFSGTKEITVFGIGSIHIRMDDGKGPGKAALLPGPARLIGISVPW